MFSLLMHCLTFLLSANFESLFCWKFFTYLINTSRFFLPWLWHLFSLCSPPSFIYRHIVGQTPLYGQPQNTDPSLMWEADSLSSAAKPRKESPPLTLSFFFFFFQKFCTDKPFLNLVSNDRGDFFLFSNSLRSKRFLARFV